MFVYSNTFHNLRPARASGFAFAWLELASHRTMIGKLLQSSPQQKVRKVLYDFVVTNG